MAESAIFDTHRFVKDLVAVGMTEPVAETLAEKQIELLTGGLAFRTELAQVEANLRSDIARVKYDLLKWMLSATGVSTAIIGVLIALFT